MMTTIRTCEVDGCSQEHCARGFCTKHYQRWQRYGDPLALKDLPDICTVEGCDRESDSRGWCRKHYSNWHRTGSPLSRAEQRANRLVDVLALDGGWLTAAALHLVVRDLGETTITYILERLEGNGRVESRRVDLGVQEGWVDRVDFRIEWRAL